MTHTVAVMIDHGICSKFKFDEKTSLCNGSEKIQVLSELIAICEDNIQTNCGDRNDSNYIHFRPLFHTHIFDK